MKLLKMGTFVSQKLMYCDAFSVCNIVFLLQNVYCYTTVTVLHSSIGILFKEN